MSEDILIVRWIRDFYPQKTDCQGVFLSIKSILLYKSIVLHNSQQWLSGHLAYPLIRDVVLPSEGEGERKSEPRNLFEALNHLWEDKAFGGPRQGKKSLFGYFPKGIWPVLQDLPHHWQLWPPLPIVIFKVKLNFAVTESFPARQATPSLHPNPCVCSCGCTFHHVKWPCSALCCNFSDQKGYVSPVAPPLNSHIFCHRSITRP